jgi:hypothetical protein
MTVMEAFSTAFELLALLAIAAYFGTPLIRETWVRVTAPDRERRPPLGSEKE